MIQLTCCEKTMYLAVNKEQQYLQTTNIPEKSTKSENINEYTLNRFVDAISLALTKWDA